MANLGAGLGMPGGGVGPGGAGMANPFAAMGMGGNDFGMGSPGMEGMDANMFGPGSPFAAMFGQAMGDMPGATGSGPGSPTASRSSSVRGAGNIGRSEERRRKV